MLTEITDPLTAEELECATSENQSPEDGVPVLPIPRDANRDDIRINGQKPTLYPYRNADGDILFYIARVDSDGSSKKIVRPVCWWKYSDGREEWKFKQPLDKNRPLLNLPQIIKDFSKTIMVVEGEKVFLAARKVFPNYVVTTSAGGSGAAAKTDWSPVNNRDVIIAIDHDEAGQQYGDDVYRLYKDAGAGSIKLLSTTIFANHIIEDGSVVEHTRDIPAGYDLADAAQEGFTAELIKELEVMLHEKGLSLFLDYPEPDGEVNIQNPRTTSLKAVNIADFLSMIIPPREMIMAPIIPEQGLVMIYAPRGVGKTYVALTIAYVIAKGGNMFDAKWSCNKPHKVLFVDGEMPASAIQERLASIVGSSDDELIGPDKLQIITPDLQDRGMPDLSTTDGQQFIEELLEGVKVLILDNLSSLCRSGRENESESWIGMQSWLLSLRQRGISVCFIHHANKNGDQRGNSKKEDVVDTVISLRRLKNHNPSDGARFAVHYEKSRGFYGEEAEPFEGWLKTTEDGKLYWQVSELEDLQEEDVRALSESGLSQRKIAEELDISASTVNRILKKKNDEN